MSAPEPLSEALWPCDDYKPPLTCFTTPHPKTLTCEGCRTAFPDGAETRALYAGQRPDSGDGGLLCSQCGEQPAAMLKIGTDDGWCVACLDEAADDGLRARVEALADEWERKQIAYTPRGTANALRAALAASRDEV